MKNKYKTILFITFSILTVGWSFQNAVAAPPSTYGETCSTNAQCDDGLFCNGVEICHINKCTLGSAPLPPRGGSMSTTRWRCDEVQDRFILVGNDVDGDGHDSYDLGGDDCNDHDANAYPGNIEICDSRGHDEDCDPTTVGVKDTDGDGYNDMKCFNTGPDGRRIYDTTRH